MHTKDITSKQLLKRMAADLANLLLKLDIDPESVELLETQHQRVEERRARLARQLIGLLDDKTIAEKTGLAEEEVSKLKLH